MENKYAVVITTFSTDEDAKMVIDELLRMQLAACIQLFHVDSFYSWEGNIENDPESIIFIKCKASNYEKIEECIIKLHKYDTPEIIMLPITNGSKKYLEWIDAVSK